MITDEFFYRMLTPEAMEVSKEYHQDEKSAMMQCLEEIYIENFVAVGAGALWGLREGLSKAQRYICIEPLTDVFITDSIQYLVENNGRIYLVNKRFDECIQTDILPGRSFFLFFFNLIAYLDDPIHHINKLITPGDVLFFSTWSYTNMSLEIQEKYFTYLNKIASPSIDPPGFFDLKNFPCHKITNYHSHLYIPGPVANSLIIYTGDTI